MNHIFTDVTELPSVDGLKRELQALAMLDSILMPDWELRYFSFNSKWGLGETMGSMRDGQGNGFFFLFSSAGVVGKIYCRGVAQKEHTVQELKKIPGGFSSFLNEPAFGINTEAMYYLWRQQRDGLWSLIPQDTVGIPLLAFIANRGSYYHKWAEDYYETELDIKSIEAIYQWQPLTEKFILTLNPDAEIEGVFLDAKEIGYPSRRQPR